MNTNKCCKFGKTKKICKFTKHYIINDTKLCIYHANILYKDYVRFYLE